MNAQKLQISVEYSGQFELLVKDCNHEVGAHCYPDLSLHCVGTRAVVVFDSEHGMATMRNTGTYTSAGQELCESVYSDAPII